MNVQSRQQWGDSGGFCGSMSIQAIAMNYGCWISQSQVRRAAGPGGGHGDPENGYEILHTNIEGALDTLKLTHTTFDYNSSLPQTSRYLSYLKKELSAGHPVVWMIMCKGDSHDTYGIADYDHVEPVWGIFSNHSLNDTTVYPDDVIVHGADYGAYHTTEGPSLYRTMSSLPDSKAMDGNCKDAQPGVGRNEYYPCVPSKTKDYGFAITGVVENMVHKSKPLFLAVNLFDEPDVYAGAPPTQLEGTITVSELTPGTDYTLYRWNDYHNVPTDTEYADSAYTSKHTFTATSSTYVYADPAGIESSETTYYRCVAE